MKCKSQLDNYSFKDEKFRQPLVAEARADFVKLREKYTVIMTNFKI